jgi:transcriptional regulator with PAS, ATPase and Fis domain
MVPSLRQRSTDIELTTDYMIDKWCTKLGKIKPKVSDAFMKTLMNHQWPGNVRELENAIEYAVNICDEATLSTHHLPKRIWQAPKGEFAETQQNNTEIKTIETLEKEAIINAIRIYSKRSDTMGKVAEVLGLSRATLYRKIKQYGLKHL